MISPAFRYNAENVRYNATSFGSGDGVTSTFGLLDRHGNPISSGKLKRVDAIHRTDWQGRQLLSASARTNKYKNSQDSTGSGWVHTGTSTIASAIAAPDGSIAQKIVEDTSSGIHRIYQSTSNSAGTWVFSFFAKAAERTIVRGIESSLNGARFDLSSGVATADAGGAAGMIPYPNGWYRCWFFRTSSTQPLLVLQVILLNALNTNYTGDGSSGAYVFGAQLEAAALTPYIVTAGAAATVTDYTLTGASVALGQVPVSGAILDWTGVAFR